MTAPVFQALKASATVKNIVGTNPPRIWHVDAPQDRERPYITWFEVVGTPENTLSETPATDRSTVQVDCWHKTQQGAQLLYESSRDAIEPYAHMTSTVFDGKEPETDLYRKSAQFDWFVDR